MKKKKLKKLAKFIFNEVEGMNNRKRTSELMPIKEEISQSYCEYDQEVSDKFFNFICNLMKLKSHLSIEIYDGYITLYGDLDRVNYSSSPTKYSSNEDTIEVKVDRTGFRIRRSYGNYLNYFDDQMLEKLKPMLIEKNKVISKDIVLDIIDDTMVKTNLSRENNLDELLKG
jgi:hypothetical protein